MARNCKTCKQKIGQEEQTFFCVACKGHMHLGPTCTGFSNVALNGIREIEANAMFLCNKCVDNNERDFFIKSRMKQKMDDQLESLNVEEQMSRMKQKIDDQVKSLNIEKKLTKLESKLTELME